MESPEGNATTTKEKTVERPQEKSRTFYGKVTKECTCGKCYSKLARYDRMPWSWDGKCATNSLGDRYVPKSCGMTKNVAPCMGYIQHPKPSAHDLLIAKSSAVAHTTTGRLELDKRKVAASEKLVESNERLKEDKRKKDSADRTKAELRKETQAKLDTLKREECLVEIIKGCTVRRGLAYAGPPMTLTVADLRAAGYTPEEITDLSLSEDLTIPGKTPTKPATIRAKQPKNSQKSSSSKRNKVNTNRVDSDEHNLFEAFRDPDSTASKGLEAWKASIKR